MAGTALLIAILIVMAFTPLGYLRIGLLAISFLTIPVAVGAIVLGPLSGLILGTAFGVTSFVQCFGMDPFGTALFSISPVLTFIMCIPTRMLCGYLAGLVFKGLHRLDKTKTVSYFVSGLLTALFNTIFFMSILIPGFYHTDYIQSVANDLGAKGVMGFLVAMVGLNGVLEMVACAVIGGGIAKAVSLIVKRTSDGAYV